MLGNSHETETKTLYHLAKGLKEHYMIRQANTSKQCVAAPISLDQRSGMGQETNSHCCRLGTGLSYIVFMVYRVL